MRSTSRLGAFVPMLFLGAALVLAVVGDITTVAAEAPIPQLVQESDMRGILHLHTTWSDGVHSVEEMVQAARKRDARFIGISDHSKSAFYANGLDEKRVQEQHREIDWLRKQYQDITIFKGIEADILADGSMDYSDAVLATFDFVIASVHSKFKMTETEGTERILRAMRNPYVRILGHPTGRLLLAREGYPVNIPAIIDAARDANVVIELNANPHRLDLDWRYVRYALDQGVVIAINPDAHRIEDYDYVEIGVGVARKGWATPEQVLNTWTANQVANFFKGGYGKKN